MLQQIHNTIPTENFASVTEHNIIYTIHTPHPQIQQHFEN